MLVSWFQLTTDPTGKPLYWWACSGLARALCGGSGPGVSDPGRRMASDRSELLVNQPEISSWMSENLEKRRFR